MPTLGVWDIRSSTISHTALTVPPLGAWDVTFSTIYHTALTVRTLLITSLDQWRTLSEDRNLGWGERDGAFLGEDTDKSICVWWNKEVSAPRREAYWNNIDDNVGKIFISLQYFYECPAIHVDLFFTPFLCLIKLPTHKIFHVMLHFETSSLTTCFCYISKIYLESPFKLLLWFCAHFCQIKMCSFIPYSKKQLYDIFMYTLLLYTHTPAFLVWDFKW